jgi:hypothetical protein
MTEIEDAIPEEDILEPEEYTTEPPQEDGPQDDVSEDDSNS